MSAPKTGRTVDLHIQLPESTLAHADDMAAEDAWPHKPNRQRWIADLIEAEWARRQSKPAKKGGRR